MRRFCFLVTFFRRLNVPLAAVMGRNRAATTVSWAVRCRRLLLNLLFFNKTRHIRCYDCCSLIKHRVDSLSTTLWNLLILLKALYCRFHYFLLSNWVFVGPSLTAPLIHSKFAWRSLEVRLCTGISKFTTVFSFFPFVLLTPVSHLQNKTALLRTIHDNSWIFHLLYIFMKI